MSRVRYRSRESQGMWSSYVILLCLPHVAMQLIELRHTAHPPAGDAPYYSKPLCSSTGMTSCMYAVAVADADADADAARHTSSGSRPLSHHLSSLPTFVCCLHLQLRHLRLRHLRLRHGNGASFDHRSRSIRLGFGPISSQVWHRSKRNVENQAVGR